MFESRESLAWAAGLFEGEGSIFGSKSSSSIIVAIAMTDKDVLDKFASVIGLPISVIARKKTNKHKQVYEWRTAKYEYSQAVVAMLWPWLCSRRREQAKTLLLRASSGRRSPGTGPDLSKSHCKNGHPFYFDNVYIAKKGTKVCKKCRLASFNKNKHKYVS